MQFKQIFIVLFVEAISMNEGSSSSISTTQPPSVSPPGSSSSISTTPPPSVSPPGSSSSISTPPPPTPGELLLRCYNDTFDTLMCLPGTVVSITRISVVASTTVCRLSQGHCTVEWPADREFSARARTACDGRLTCNDLRADVDKVQCGGASNYVNVSNIIIKYTCMNSTINADFRHAIRCSGKNFTSSFCLGAETIEVANVYIGATDTSSCRATTGPMGSVLRRLDNSSDVVFAYRQQCDGQTACVNTTTVGLAHEFTLLEYRCTGTDGDTTSDTPAVPAPTSSPSSSSSVSSSTSVSHTSSSSPTDDHTTITSGDTSSDDNVDTTINAGTANEPNSFPVTEVAIAVPVSVLVLVVVILLVVCLVRRRKRKKYIWGESEASAGGEHLTHGSNRANSGGWNSEINGGYDMSATSSPTHSSHPDLVPTNSMTRPSSTASETKRNTANKNSYRKTMDVIVEYQPEGPLADVEPRPSFSIAIGSGPRGYIRDEPVGDAVQDEESKSEVEKTAIPESVTEFPATDNGTTKSQLKPSFSISMGSDSHGYSEVQPLSATKLETASIADSTTPGPQDVTPGAKVNPPDVPGSKTLGIMTEERGATSNIYSEVRKPEEEEQPKATGIALYSGVDNGMGNPDTRYRPTDDTDIYSEVRDPTKSVVDNVTHSDAPKNVDTPADGETPDQVANNVYSEVLKPKHTSPDGNTADDTSCGIANQEDTSANIYSEVQKPNKPQADRIAAEINDAKTTSETTAGDENPEDTSPIYSGDGQPPILPARQYTDDLTQDNGLPGISNDGNENSKPEQTPMDEIVDASSEGRTLTETPDQNDGLAETTYTDASVSKQEQPDGHSVTMNNDTD